MSDSNDHQASGDEGTSLAQNRTRREKRGKTSSRADLLSKIRRQRETGERVEIEDKEDDIYEYVDDSKYTDIMRERQESEWIVEDHTGYKEDGRDIFDEIEESDEETQGQEGKKDKKRNPNIRKPQSGAKSLKAMFAASAASSRPKQKEELIKKHDDILNSILAQAADPSVLNTTTPQLTPIALHKKKETLSIFKKNTRPVKPPARLDHRTHHVQVKSEPKSTQENLEQLIDLPAPVTIKPEVPEPTPVDDQMGELDDGLDSDMMEFEEAKPIINIPKPEPRLSDSWMVSEEDQAEVKPCPANSSLSGTDLPLVEVSGEDVFRFYWLDAYEDHFKHPGTIYLFGKTQLKEGNFVSCCVAIRNIYRRVFILPRQCRYDSHAQKMTEDPVKFIDVYSEFNERVAPKFKIKNFKSRAIKRLYAFEKEDVPYETEYLEVRYGPDQTALPKDLTGDTFSEVFGTNTSSLELFLLEQKIRGPCWLDVKQPRSSPHSMSWCKKELMVEDFKTVGVASDKSGLAPPPLVTMTLSVKSVINEKTKQSEIVQVACLVNNSYNVDKPAPSKLFHQHFLICCKPGDREFPYDMDEKKDKAGKSLRLEMAVNERQLLALLLAKIHSIDPDILVGHDVANFEFNRLMNRIEACKVAFWHKVSRLKRTTAIPRKGAGRSGQVDMRSLMCGRIVCDVMISAREVIRAKSYDLTVLVEQILKQKRDEVDGEALRDAYLSSTELLRLSNLTIQDAFYAHKIMFELNVLPLAWQITTICGNVLSRTLLGGRSERNEFLLLHAFSDRDFICPDKQYGQAKDKKGRNDSHVEPGDEDEAIPNKPGRRKPAYAGGLVLEPKKGFYDTFILLLDFNSLYPSIIQEYNVCFTTVKQNTGATEEGEMVLPDLPDSSAPLGVLPVEIRKLVESRKQVKSLMKDKNVSPEQMAQYDIRQKALKLTANSMYGCLGFTYSRFFAKPLAALITAKGREILQKTKELVEKQGLEVIYGDTDSIMINTNSRDMDEVFKLGNKVKQEVNKAYRLLEIDIDGVFKSMLLLKKKKYAALNISRSADGSITTNQELKGLDIVRRDWCELSKQTGHYVVNELLSGEAKDTILDNIHNKLAEVKAAVHAGEIPLEHYCITKQLTKDPASYPDKNSLPHVQVALRRNTSDANGKRMAAGDTVYYVICQDGSSLSASQRAYHPDEMAKNNKLTVDHEYYLSHQIHPVVSRLIDPIEGTDASIIATMLGLDASRYRHKVSQDDLDTEEAHHKLLSEAEKYELCDKLKVKCHFVNCGLENIVAGPYRAAQDGKFESSWVCLQKFPGKGNSLESHDIQLTPTPDESQASVVLLKNRIALALRGHIRKYYQAWLKCEDEVCAHRTRKLPLQLYKGRPVCQQCKKSHLNPEYTDTMLYTQLCYYRHVFEFKKPNAAEKDLETPLAIRQLCQELKEYCEHRLSKSAYGQIDLNGVFQTLYGKH